MTVFYQHFFKYAKSVPFRAYNNMLGTFLDFINTVNSVNKCSIQVQ